MRDGAGGEFYDNMPTTLPPQLNWGRPSLKGGSWDPPLCKLRAARVYIREGLGGFCTSILAHACLLSLKMAALPHSYVKSGLPEFT